MAEGEGSFLTDPSFLVGLGLVTAGALYYAATRRQREKISVPLDNQSIELPVKTIFITLPFFVSSQGGVRISRYCVNDELISYLYEDTRTLYEVFLRGKRVSSEH